MIKTVWATVRQGKIELLEAMELPEGLRLLVTLLPDDETEFWLEASQTSLNSVWENTEDDVYVQTTAKMTLCCLGNLSYMNGVAAGFNLATAVKRGIYTVHESLIIKVIGQLAEADIKQLQQSLQTWLGL